MCICVWSYVFCFFFKQKTAYEMRISDWSSDVCSSDLEAGLSSAHVNFHPEDEDAAFGPGWLPRTDLQYHWHNDRGWQDFDEFLAATDHKHRKNIRQERARVARAGVGFRIVHGDEAPPRDLAVIRSDEHTSALQSLMRISYAGF